MKRYTLTSRCECQARLDATLDENRHVVEGRAVRHRDVENAPAHSIGADKDRFDVGWLCPYCGRNTLRTFEASGLEPASVAASLDGK